MESEPEIPVERVAAFVRQHTHDVRNGLNSLDLETSLLRELVTGGEAQECVDRVRRQVRIVAEQMRSLSAFFQDPQPMIAPISVRDLLVIWRELNADLPDAPKVEWVDELGDEKVNVDVAMMATVFRELLSNAAAFLQGGPATITARRSGRDVEFELREPKTGALDPSGWGRPFSTTRRNGYGLGLWRAGRLARANGVKIMRRYLPEESALVTRISLPVV
jgi:signal transduction histidine kinase